MPNFKVSMQEHSLSDTNLQKGNKVTFTNEFGVVFPGHTIMGFPTEPDLEKEAFINSDCYWVSKPFHQLTLEERPKFVFFEYFDLNVTHLIERAFAYSKPISQENFTQYILDQELAAARTVISQDYIKKGYLDLLEASNQCEFRNPRIGISDGSIGRRKCLNLLVELGDELLAFNAGKAWNHLA
tara:strand:+ start:48472 stop:49023 length:552 start_codon:yes stop_codon:yes gene_type:complete